MLASDSGEAKGMESDERYYARRAAEEGRRARYAVTPEARERHQELSRLFEAKAANRARITELQLIRG
jgi:cell division septum initiation protein DivIVA